MPNINNPHDLLFKETLSHKLNFRRAKVGTNPINSNYQA